MASDRNRWLPFAIMGVLVLIGGGFFYYIQFTPPKSVPEAPLSQEAKAYVGNLKLSDVDMKASKNYFSQMLVEIEGKIGNAGDRNLDSVEIYCVFYDVYGQLVLRQKLPIVSPSTGGLKPGETKSFRLPFDQIPESWNQRMPQMVIANAKFS